MSKATKKDRRRLAKSLVEILANPAITGELFNGIGDVLVEIQNDTQSFQSLEDKNIPRWLPKALKKKRRITKRQDRSFAKMKREELEQDILRAQRDRMSRGTEAD